MNFNSNLSYTDSTRTDYGDLNGDGEIEEILTELTKTDDGCIGFPQIKSFDGTFNGQGFEIKNLYQNNESGGLFKKIAYSTIKNLGLEDVLIISSGDAGGFSTTSIQCEFYNCSVSGNITGTDAKSTIGGFVSGLGSGRGGIFINCYNLSNITGGNVGGLIGWSENCFASYSIEIINCYNLGEIDGGSFNQSYRWTAGLLGGAYNATDGERKMVNCCSIGKISSPSSIFYNIWTEGSIELESCYYLDEILKTNIKNGLLMWFDKIL